MPRKSMKPLTEAWLPREYNSRGWRLYYHCLATRFGLGAAHTYLISRASLGSSGNLLGLGKSWPPGRWRPMPPSIVVDHLFNPQDIQYHCGPNKWTITREGGIRRHFPGGQDWLRPNRLPDDPEEDLILKSIQTTPNLLIVPFNEVPV